MFEPEDPFETSPTLRRMVSIKLLLIGVNRRFTRNEALEVGIQETVNTLKDFGYVAHFSQDEFYITTKGWALIYATDADDNGLATSANRL